MLHFIYGVPGSGKSSYLTNQIKKRLETGVKALLLVPERFCVSAEKEVCHQMQTSTRLNLDILSFKRLCNTVFRLYGGLKDHYALKGGRMLIMWKALSSVKKELEACSKLRLSDTSTVEAMLDSIVSFERSAIKKEQLLEISESKELKNSPELSKKLRDLAKIWDVYERELKEKYDDPEEDLTRLYKQLESHPEFLREREVFVDSTTAFSGQELEIMRLVLRYSPNVTVVVPKLPEDHRMMQARVDFFTQRLLDLATEECVETEKESPVLYTPYKKTAEDLLHLEKELYGSEEPFSKRSAHICIESAESPYEEAVKASSEILKNIIEEGGRYAENAVAVRDLQSYLGILDRVFEENHIPYVLAKSDPLSDTGAFRLLMSVLRLRDAHFRLEDLFTFIRTGYTDLTEEEEFLLEDYSNLWNIEGNRWLSDLPFGMNPLGRTVERTPAGEEKLEKINRAKEKLMVPLRTLFEDIRDATVLQICTAFYEYLERLHLDEKLELQALYHEEKGESREAQKYRQIWRELCSLLDELVFTLGDVVPKKEELPVFFEVLAKQRELSAIPTGIDRVLISDTFNLKAQGVKNLYVLGVNEGVFPADISGEGFFRFKDLDILKKAGLDLPGSRLRKVLDEEYICYSTLTFPSDKLYLSYYKKNLNGVGSKPSELYETVKTLFAKRDPIKKSLPYGESNLLEYALSKEKKGEEDPVLSYFKNQKGSLFDHQEHSALIDRAQSLSLPFVSNYYEKGIQLSQTKLETFVNCPFAYSCKYLLKIRDLPKGSVGNNEIGSIIHKILEVLLNGSRKKGEDFGKKTDEELDSAISEISEKMKKTIMGNEKENLQMEQIFRRVIYSVQIFAKNIRDEFAQSAFKPVFTELSFGNKGHSFEGAEEETTFSLPEIRFTVPMTDENGNTKKVMAYLRGTADRVDAYKKDGKLYVRIVDYKTGNKKFKMDGLKECTNIQMPLYLAAFQKEQENDELKKRMGGEKEDEICPAGMLYYVASYPHLKVEYGKEGMQFTKEQLEDKIRKSITRSGWLIDDEEVLRAMEKEKTGNYIFLKKSGSAEFSSEEEMSKMLEELSLIVKEKTEEILSGDMRALPKNKNDYTNGCTYCPMGPICRRSVEKDGEEEDS